MVSEVHKEAISLAWQVEPPASRGLPGAWRHGPVRVRSVAVSLPRGHPRRSGRMERLHRETRGHTSSDPRRHASRGVRANPSIRRRKRTRRSSDSQFHADPRRLPASCHPRVPTAPIPSGPQDSRRSNPTPLAEVIARAVSGTLSRFLIPKLAGEAKLVPLSALAAQSLYAAAYLRQLVLSRRLRAIRDGHLWLSSRAWLNEYMASRDPRGGKPAGHRARSARL